MFGIPRLFNLWSDKNKTKRQITEETRRTEFENSRGMSDSLREKCGHMEEEIENDLKNGEFNHSHIEEYKNKCKGSSKFLIKEYTSCMSNAKKANMAGEYFAAKLLDNDELSKSGLVSEDSLLKMPEGKVEQYHQEFAAEYEKAIEYLEVAVFLEEHLNEKELRYAHVNLEGKALNIENKKSGSMKGRAVANIISAVVNTDPGAVIGRKPFLENPESHLQRVREEYRGLEKILESQYR